MSSSFVSSMPSKCRGSLSISTLKSFTVVSSSSACFAMEGTATKRHQARVAMKRTMATKSNHPMIFVMVVTGVPSQPDVDLRMMKRSFGESVEPVTLAPTLPMVVLVKAWPLSGAKSLATLKATLMQVKAAIYKKHSPSLLRNLKYSSVPTPPISLSSLMLVPHIGRHFPFFVGLVFLRCSRALLRFGSSSASSTASSISFVTSAALFLFTVSFSVAPSSSSLSLFCLPISVQRMTKVMLRQTKPAQVIQKIQICLNCVSLLRSTHEQSFCNAHIPSEASSSGLREGSASHMVTAGERGGDHKQSSSSLRKRPTCCWHRGKSPACTLALVG
mmetsp:Transcript_45231/g.128044  ORF Transcript_45231/g.128044 Transcript_45231/m.128044 type:complete len:331 (+) Transcript_45231:1769-2761(+)